ncbi:MAG: hypothetical protein HY294_00385 [Candidatus Rokubacteria bacterium]|nr:hypothetical protein [Candidatus Rokubacteria bacterium]MBI3824436.1 hypothetical protein [Candidatus Rokubacteria bacterium]
MELLVLVATLVAFAIVGASAITSSLALLYYRVFHHLTWTRATARAEERALAVWRLVVDFFTAI